MPSNGNTMFFRTRPPKCRQPSDPGAILTFMSTLTELDHRVTALEDLYQQELHSKINSMDWAIGDVHGSTKATRADVRHMRKAIDSLDEQVSELRHDISTLEPSVRNDIRAFREEVNQRFKKAEDQMNVRFEESEERTAARFKESQDRTDARFKESQERTDARFKAVDERFDRMDAKLDEVLAAVRPRKTDK